jgi:hypothetical protein
VLVWLVFGQILDYEPRPVFEGGTIFHITTRQEQTARYMVPVKIRNARIGRIEYIHGGAGSNE